MVPKHRVPDIPKHRIPDVPKHRVPDVPKHRVPDVNEFAEDDFLMNFDDQSSISNGFALDILKKEFFP